jgi:hypothetical protein
MTAKPSRTLASVVLSLCLLLSFGATGGVATSAESAVGFGSDTLVQEHGDVVTVPIELTNADSATVRIRSATQDYLAELDVTDGNGDGTVVLEFNTFHGVDRPGRPAFGTVAAADAVTVHTQRTDQSLPVLETGRYHLIAATEDTRISTEVILTGSDVGESRTVQLPSTASQGENVTRGGFETDANESLAIARGDVAQSRFEVSGIGGALQGTVPGQNLIFANDSAPGVKTTHRLRVSPDESVTTKRVTINYDAGDGGVPPDLHRLSQNALEEFGVDTNADGRIDRSVVLYVSNIRTDSSGRAVVTFDRPIELSASDQLLAEYSVTNPDASGADDVTVTLGQDASAETGTVVYGPAGQGTLGYGLDLRLVSDDGSEFVTPFSASSVTYDSASNLLVVTTNTTKLGVGSHEVRFRIRDDAQVGHPATTMVERLYVESPNAVITDVSADDETLSVAGETNLAPGTELWIRVGVDQSADGVQFLSLCSADVSDNRTVSCEFVTPSNDSRMFTENDVDVSIRTANGTVLAGPVRYDGRDL